MSYTPNFYQNRESEDFINRNYTPNVYHSNNARNNFFPNVTNNHQTFDNSSLLSNLDTNCQNNSNNIAYVQPMRQRISYDNCEKDDFMIFGSAIRHTSKNNFCGDKKFAYRNDNNVKYFENDEHEYLNNYNTQTKYNARSEIDRLLTENKNLRSQINYFEDRNDDVVEIIEENARTYSLHNNSKSFPDKPTFHNKGVGDYNVNDYFLINTESNSINPSDFSPNYWERLSSYFEESFSKKFSNKQRVPSKMENNLFSTQMAPSLSVKNVNSITIPETQEIINVFKNAPVNYITKCDISCMTDNLDEYFAHLLNTLIPQYPNADKQFIKNLYQHSQTDCSEFITRLISKLDQIRQISLSNKQKNNIFTDSVGINVRPVMMNKRTSSLPPYRYNLGVNTETPIYRTQGMLHTPEEINVIDIGCSTPFLNSVDLNKFRTDSCQISIPQSLDYVVNDPLLQRQHNSKIRRETTTTTVKHQKHIVTNSKNQKTELNCNQLHKNESFNKDFSPIKIQSRVPNETNQISNDLHNRSISENVFFESYNPSYDTVDSAVSVPILHNMMEDTQNNQISPKSETNNFTPSSSFEQKKINHLQKSNDFKEANESIINKTISNYDSLDNEVNPILTSSSYNKIQTNVEDISQYVENSQPFSQIQYDLTNNRHSISSWTKPSSLKQPIKIPERNYSFTISENITTACEFLANWYTCEPGSPTPLVQEHVSTMSKIWFALFNEVNLDKTEDLFAYLYGHSPELLYLFIRLPDSNNSTCLHFSIGHEAWRVVSLILDTNYADVDKLNNSGFSPIMLAALTKSIKASEMSILERLFQLGNVNARIQANANQTPLILSARKENVDICRLLIKCGAEVNDQDASGNTALMCAAQYGRFEIANALLECPQIDLQLQDKEGLTAFDIALSTGNSEIAALISDKSVQMRGIQNHFWSSVRNSNGSVSSLPTSRVTHSHIVQRSQKSSIKKL